MKLSITLRVPRRSNRRGYLLGFLVLTLLALSVSAETYVHGWSDDSEQGDSLPYLDISNYFEGGLASTQSQNPIAKMAGAVALDENTSVIFQLGGYNPSGNPFTSN